MAIVNQALGGATEDLEETLGYAAEELTAYATDVVTLAQAALGETGVLRYTFIRELEIKMSRVEAALITMREMSKELGVRAERIAG